MLKKISFLHRKTQVYLNDQAKTLSLTGGQIVYIVCICEFKSISQNKLAEIIGIDKSTVTKMLNRLEAEGYITRIVDEDDNRAFYVMPTEKALEIYPKAIEIGNIWYKKVTSSLTSIEKNIFEQLMDKVVKNTADYFNEEYFINSKDIVGNSDEGV